VPRRPGLPWMFWPFSKTNSFFPANAIAVDLGTANTLI
jgi:rod shape-determining protein MreB